MKFFNIFLLILFFDKAACTMEPYQIDDGVYSIYNISKKNYICYSEVGFPFCESKEMPLSDKKFFWFIKKSEGYLIRKLNSFEYMHISDNYLVKFSQKINQSSYFVIKQTKESAFLIHNPYSNRYLFIPKETESDVLFAQSKLEHDETSLFYINYQICP